MRTPPSDLNDIFLSIRSLFPLFGGNESRVCPFFEHCWSGRIGVNHGTRCFALAARRSYSDHYYSGAVFPLIVGFPVLPRLISITEGGMSDAIVSSRSGRSAESAISGVSWAAIFAGAFVASAFSLALLALGAGLGLVSVSPWSGNGVSAATFGILAAAWLIAIQLFASGVGGYIAGRLRTVWVNTHSDEVFFRDTAHGLLVWAVGAVVSASILASAASSLASGVASTGAASLHAAGSALAGAASQVASQTSVGATDPTAYFTDMLFRTDHPSTTADQAGSQAEIGRILTRSLASGDLAVADKTYIAQVVAARTGLSQPDAEKRVSDVFAQAKADAAAIADKAKAAADEARKAGIYLALWTFISLLVGAFSASYMATVGGRIRDDLPVIG